MQQRRAPPHPIRKTASDRSADHGAQQNRAYNDFFLQSGQAEVLLNEKNRAGDDAGVVAKEQSGKRGDSGYDRDERPALRGRFCFGGSHRALRKIMRPAPVLYEEVRCLVGSNFPDL